MANEIKALSMTRADDCNHILEKVKTCCVYEIIETNEYFIYNYKDDENVVVDWDILYKG